MKTTSQSKKDFKKFTISTLAEAVTSIKDRKILAGTLAATALGISAPAMAVDLNIQYENSFGRQITETKTQELAQAVSDQAVVNAQLHFILSNWDKYTVTERNAALATIPVLKTGDSIDIFKLPANQTTSRVADEPYQRIGSGSRTPTKMENGVEVLDIENVRSATFGGVTKNFAGGTSSGVISVGNADEKRTIVNAAAGRISATSTDVINGSQLFAAKEAIDTNATNITNLTNKVNQGLNFTGTTGTDNVQLGETVTVNGTNGNIVTAVTNNRIAIGLGDTVTLNEKLIVGTGTGVNQVSVGKDGISGGNKKILNVAPATLSATSTDVVNGSQLHATNQKVDSGFNISDKTNTDNVKLTETITFGNTDNNLKATVGNNLVNYDLSDNVNVKTSITTGGGKVRFTANGGDMGGTKIVNTADGLISADSKEVVNGSQIYALKDEINTKLGDVVYYDAGSNKTSVTFGGVGATTPVTLKNVGKGDVSATSTQAINGSQLYEVKNDLKDVKDEVAKGYTFTGDTGSKNFKLGSEVSIKGGESKNIVTKMNAETNTMEIDFADNLDIKGDVKIGGTLTMNDSKITNVKAGEISNNSTDVVIGSQLYQTNTNLDALKDKVNLGWNLGDVTGKSTNIQQGDTVTLKNNDGNLKITVTDKGADIDLADNLKIGGLEAGDYVTINKYGDGRLDVGGTQITGVGEGTRGTDAVNVNQLNRAVNNLNNRIDEVEDDAKRGTAAAIAVASLGQPFEYGKNTISVAGSAYDGKAGWAVGGGHTTDNGRWMVKYNVSGSDSKKVGFGGSVTYQY